MAKSPRKAASHEDRQSRVPLFSGSWPRKTIEVGDDVFRRIELDVRGFRSFGDFSISAETQEAIREAVRFYCFLDDNKGKAATVAEIELAMNDLMATAKQLQQTIERLSGPSNPHNMTVICYLNKHGYPDLEDLLGPLISLSIACERTTADVRKHIRKNQPDEALEFLTFTLADIFERNYRRPTANYSSNTGGYTPFVSFIWGIYDSLPHAGPRLCLGAFQERAKRTLARRRRSNKQVAEANEKAAL